MRSSQVLIKANTSPWGLMPYCDKLINALADPDKRAGATSALSEIGQPAVDALTAVLHDDQRGPWVGIALSMIRGD
jgi:hypothetical protein